MSQGSFAEETYRAVSFRGAAQITWEEYSKARPDILRFPEWENAVIEMAEQIRHRNYIPRVAMHLTDKKTQAEFGVSFVYVLTHGVDYLFFYYTDDLAVIFFISTPLEVQVDTAFRAPH